MNFIEYDNDEYNEYDDDNLKFNQYNEYDDDLELDDLYYGKEIKDKKNKIPKYIG